MPRPFFLLLCVAFVCGWMSLSLRAIAEPKSVPPATQSLGWGSAWSEQPAGRSPAQALAVEISQEEKAHHYQAVLPLADQLAKQLSPGDPYPVIRRVRALHQLERDDQAFAAIDQGLQGARQHDRTDWEARLFIARAHLRQARHEDAQAAADLQSALRSDPENVSALNNLAWLRATAPEAACRNGAEAVRLARKAASLTPGGAGSGLTDTLASAYAEAGDYGRAVETEQKALGLARADRKGEAGLPMFQREASARLLLFQGNQPYHAPTPF